MRDLEERISDSPAQRFNFQVKLTGFLHQRVAPRTLQWRCAKSRLSQNYFMKVKFPVKFIFFLRFKPIWSFEAAHLLSYESCEFDGPVVPIRRAKCLNSYG